MVIAYRFVLYLVINCVGTFAHSRLSSIFGIFLHSIDSFFLSSLSATFPSQSLSIDFFFNFVRKFPKSFDVFIIIMFGGIFLQFKYWFLVGYHFLDKFSDYGFLFSFFFFIILEILHTLCWVIIFLGKFFLVCLPGYHLCGEIFLRLLNKYFFTFLIT